MRPLHSTITPAVVHRQARTLLQGVFDWTPVGRSVAVTDLLDVLLLPWPRPRPRCSPSCAASSRSVTRPRRGRVKANLGRCPAAGVQGLLQALHEAPRSPAATGGGGGCWPIDTHYVPVLRPPRRSWVGGPKRQGTKWFFGYAHGRAVASGSPLHRRRVSVGPQDQAARDRPHPLAANRGPRPESPGVVARRAFRQRHNLAPVAGVRRRLHGAVATQGHPPATPRNRLFEGRHQQVRWAEWFVKDTTRQVRKHTVLWEGSPPGRWCSAAGVAPPAGIAPTATPRGKNGSINGASPSKPATGKRTRRPR